MTRRGGFTLVETLITTVLFLVVTGLTADFMVTCWRTWNQLSPRGDAAREALVITSRLRTDLTNALPQSVVVFRSARVIPNGPVLEEDAVSFLTCRSPDGQISFSAADELQFPVREVIYAHRGQVLVQTIAISPPLTDATGLPATSFTPAPTDHVLSKALRQLSMSLQACELSFSVQTEVNGADQTLEACVAPVLAETECTTQSPSPSPSP